MKRDDIDVAWEEFMLTFDRERQLPAEERGKAALRAAFRALEPNNLLEERGKKIVAAIALKHDTTSADIRSSSRVAEVVIAREEAAFELACAGLDQRTTARLLGRASSAIVGTWIRNHEARLAASGAHDREEVASG